MSETYKCEGCGTLSDMDKEYHTDSEGVELCRLCFLELCKESADEEILTLQAALTKAEAEAAVMREALKRISTGWTYKEADELSQLASDALSSTSGSKLLERMEALEKVAEAAKRLYFNGHSPMTLRHDLEALDALQSKDTL